MRLVMGVWLGLVSLALALLTVGFGVQMFSEATSFGVQMICGGFITAGVAGTVFIGGLAVVTLTEPRP